MPSKRGDESRSLLVVSADCSARAEGANVHVTESREVAWSGKSVSVPIGMRSACLWLFKGPAVMGAIKLLCSEGLILSKSRRKSLNSASVLANTVPCRYDDA